MLILYLILIAAGSFLLGGLNGSILTSRFIYKKDIREFGSGNPGLTNFHRTFGKNAVIFVILVDALKTVLPVLISGAVLSSFEVLGPDPVLFGKMYSGFFTMLGHAYPAMHGFRGGKTLLTGGTVILCADWRVAVLVWSVFLLIVIITRYISLGGILAGMFYPAAMALNGHYGWPLLFSVLSGALLVYRHKENIGRLLKGEERKFTFKRK